MWRTSLSCVKERASFSVGLTRVTLSRRISVMLSIYQNGISSYKDDKLAILVLRSSVSRWNINTVVSRARFSQQTYLSSVASPSPELHKEVSEQLRQKKGLKMKWHYLLARTRYFFMRFRPTTFDDIVAMFSWLFVGHLLLIVLATTGSAIVFLFLVNSLQFQGNFFFAIRQMSDMLIYLWGLMFLESFAYAIGKYVTQETGIQITFGSAIVPHLREGSIRFRDVIASRTFHNLPETVSIDRNQSKFELSIQSIDIKISLMRLLKGNP
jgi:hypothetical protein